MQMLVREYDLFTEEAAHDEVVLELHKRITKLAEHNDTARSLLTQMCSESVSTLFAAERAHGSQGSPACSRRSTSRACSWTARRLRKR